MLTHIIERHADEAAFLWSLRDEAVRAPRYTQAALAHLDGRVEAHLDGLRVAGEDAWEVCAEVLSLGEPGELFVVAVLALEGAAHERLAAMLDAVEQAPSLGAGVVSALGWTPLATAKEALDAFLDPRAPPLLRRLGLSGYAAHRVDPGDALEQALYAEDPALEARALRAVGELGRLGARARLAERLRAADPDVCFWAAWSGALLGVPGASDALWPFVEAGGPRARAALEVAARTGELGAVHARLDRLEVLGPVTARLAVEGAAALGDPGRLPRLLAALRDPSLARLAAHAISLVTGLDPDTARLRGARPAVPEPGPNDDPADENVAPDLDRDLVWPEPDALEAAVKSLGLRAGQRHLAGEPIREPLVARVLRSGRQDERRAAALERCLLAPGSVLCEVRAPAYRRGRA
ncbi:MAG: TIGR02270 family protein [Polyangiaceae bacterium]|nr:TIGR02270 family protein [Polyangiaceae bacterium]